MATAKGDGPAIDVRSAAHRVFLATLSITNITEQESLDISLFGSPDGAAWSPKPIVCFPQLFYRGETPLIVDLTAQPEVAFLRAHWDVNRWGRGPEAPMFEFAVRLKEIPPEVLQEATAEARSRA